MSAHQLNALKNGIVRMREKGGARKDALHDLVNGYVMLDGTVTSRPGTTEDTTLPSGTVGLCAFGGKLCVFSSAPVTMTDSDYACIVLVSPDDAELDLTAIHFAASFMNKLYVVAEFEDASIHHYWLLEPDTWAASTNYGDGESVSPTTPNGYYYKPSDADAPPVWQPNVQYAENDIVIPTTGGKWKFTATSVVGTNTASGNVEPAWPDADGATVQESPQLEGTS